MHTTDTSFRGRGTPGTPRSLGINHCMASICRHLGGDRAVKITANVWELAVVELSTWSYDSAIVHDVLTTNMSFKRCRH